MYRNFREGGKCEIKYQIFVRHWCHSMVRHICFNLKRKKIIAAELCVCVYISHSALLDQWIGAREIWVYHLELAGHLSESSASVAKPLCHEHSFLSPYSKSLQSKGNLRAFINVLLLSRMHWPFFYHDAKTHSSISSLLHFTWSLYQ